MRAIGGLTSIGLTAATTGFCLMRASERKHAERAREKEVRYQGGSNFLDKMAGVAFVVGPPALVWRATRRLRGDKW